MAHGQVSALLPLPSSPATTANHLETTTLRPALLSRDDSGAWLSRPRHQVPVPVCFTSAQLFNFLAHFGSFVASSTTVQSPGPQYSSPRRETILRTHRTRDFPAPYRGPLLNHSCERSLLPYLFTLWGSDSHQPFQCLTCNDLEPFSDPSVEVSFVHFSTGVWGSAGCGYSSTSSAAFTPPEGAKPEDSYPIHLILTLSMSYHRPSLLDSTTLVSTERNQYQRCSLSH